MLHSLRSKSLAAALALFVACGARAQTEVVIPLGPLEDPEVTSHIAGISAPSRFVQMPVLVRGGRDTAQRTVQVVGPLTNDDLETLVRLIGFYSQSLDKLTGDSMFALAHCGASCGPNCKRDIQMTFSRAGGRWKLLYRIDS